MKEGTRLNREGKTRPTLLIDKIDKSASRWMHADILVFNTGHWWTHGKTARGYDVFSCDSFLFQFLHFSSGASVMK